MTVCQIFFKLKFSKFIQNFRTLDVFGKFILIVETLRYQAQRSQQIFQKFSKTIFNPFYLSDFSIYECVVPCYLYNFTIIKWYQISPFMNKVHIFWEGHKILQNLHRKFDWHYIGQIYSGGFAKFCGLLRICEL